MPNGTCDEIGRVTNVLVEETDRAKLTIRRR